MAASRSQRLLAGLMVAFFFCACGASGTFELTVKVAEGVDPLAAIDRLKLIFTNPRREEVVNAIDPDQFSVEIDLDVSGEVSRVVLEGYRSEQLLARGATPPFIAQPTDAVSTLLVGPAGSVGVAPARLLNPSISPAVTLLTALGVLISGGEAPDGSARTDVALYDFFTHELRQLPDLPEGVGGASGIPCGAACGLVVFGRSNGDLSRVAQRYAAGGWQEFSDGLSDGDRRHSATVLAWDTSRSLVVGGLDAEGEAVSTVILVTAPDAPATPSFEKLPGISLDRKEPAAAVVDDMLVVVGGAADKPVAVGYVLTPDGASNTTQPFVWQGPEPLWGSAAATLSDGRIIVIGGRDAQGSLLKDAWILESTGTVTHVADVLEFPRTGHRVVRLGEELVVVGGRDATATVPSVEVLDAQTLFAIRRGELHDVDTGFSISQLGPGQLMLAGGSRSGVPSDQIGIYQSAVPE